MTDLLHGAAILCLGIAQITLSRAFTLHIKGCRRGGGR